MGGLTDNSREAITFGSVTAGYRSQPVLRDVTLSIAEGEMVGLIGPNGAGKTTMLRCITGLCRPSQGCVSLFGHDVSRMQSSERARLAAVVPSELETPMAFTVEELAQIGRTASMPRWHGPSGSDSLAVETALRQTDMLRMRSRLLTELSAGEKQRAVCAMALAQSPRVILLDEATSHLDMIHCFDVMRIVRRLNRDAGMTVVMISHDLNLAARFCDRLLLMLDGRIVADGAPESVLTEHILQSAYGCHVSAERSELTGTVTVFPRMDDSSPAGTTLTGKDGNTSIP
ncbi:MAG: ABC transporter ATP-binding protein [Lentisphaerae bacterium]|nr:ABC transporter ATP-binding protein [Lentisphaerota bacterium]